MLLCRSSKEKCGIKAEESSVNRRGSGVHLLCVSKLEALGAHEKSTYAACEYWSLLYITGSELSRVGLGSRRSTHTVSG